jgi:hypothetical protein
MPIQILPELAPSSTGCHKTINPKITIKTAAIPTPEFREALPVKVKGPVGVGEALIPPLADVFTAPPCVEVEDSALKEQTVVYKLRVSVVRYPPLEYVSVVYTVEVNEDSGSGEVGFDTGQNVVVILMTSVVFLPIGQFVTVGGQEVIV